MKPEIFSSGRFIKRFEPSCWRVGPAERGRPGWSEIRGALARPGRSFRPHLAAVVTPISWPVRSVRLASPDVADLLDGERAMRLVQLRVADGRLVEAIPNQAEGASDLQDMGERATAIQPQSNPSSPGTKHLMPRAPHHTAAENRGVGARAPSIAA
jgi:hypothetical protein